LAALGLVAGVVLLFRVLYSQTPALTIDFNHPDQTPAQLLQLDEKGFFAAESNKEFGGYRWTQPTFSLDFSYLPRHDYNLRLWAAGPLSAPVKIEANSQSLAGFTLSANAPPRSYDILIPAQLIKDGAIHLKFQTTPFEPKNDRRGQLGLLVTRLELERQPGGLLLPPRALLQALGLAALLWGLVLAGPVLAALSPGLFRRKGFWLLLLTVAGGQWCWLVLQYAGQPFSLAPSLDNLFYNLARLLLAEYAVVLSVFLSYFFIKWFGASRIAGENQPPASNGRPVKQLNALTSLRFFAALLVMGYHLPLAPDLPLGIYGFLRQGYVGVSLFYVLSGFILCYNYFPSFQNSLKSRFLKKFWVARFARVYPMYLLTFVLSLVIKNSFQQVSPGLALLHVFALQSYLPDKTLVINAFNGPAWSVSVEFFFYLLFPFLLFWAVRHLKTPVQILGAAALCWFLQLGLETFCSNLTPDTQEYLFYWFGPGRLCEFLIGILVGKLFLSWQGRPIKPVNFWVAVFLTLLGIAIVAGIMFLPRNEFQIYRYGTIYAPAFACLIYFLARYNTWFSRIMSRPALVLLGEASYSFYLLHDLVIRAMTNQYNFVPPGLAAYLLFGAILIVTALLSLMGFRWYETPTRRWLRGWFDSRGEKLRVEEVSPKP
jgi:peptidoglycan/LPS O-acetylase OafA/YrhL